MSQTIVSWLLIGGDDVSIARLKVEENEGVVLLGGDEFEGHVEQCEPASIQLQIISRHVPPLKLLCGLSADTPLTFDIQWANGGAFCGVGADIWGRAQIRDGKIERIVEW